MRLGLALCLALTLAVPAGAQQRDDRRSDLEQPSSAVAVKKLHQYSRCVALRFPTRAANVLAIDYRTPEYGAAISKLAQSQRSCAWGYLHFNRMLLAGGLAETLLERDGAKGLGTRLSGQASIEARDDIEFTSLCIVRKTPDAVVALLATEPASDAEKTALNAITPMLPGCIRNGMQVRFNRQGLRAVLALAAYRIATKPKTTALQAVMPTLGACMPEGQTMKFSRPMLRGALAEALYKAATYKGPRVPAAPPTSSNQSVN